MKKLNNNELQTVLSFIQRRGFCYIDVQTELLDHVACRVEEIMDENSEISLESAIEKAHGEFGIFGFSTVEDGIINGLTKKYNRLFWRTFISFFGPKYILLVLFAGYAIYKFEEFVNSKSGIYVSVLISFLTAILCLYKAYRPAYKQYLAYRLSTMYFIGLGSLYSLMMLIIREVNLAVPSVFNLGLAVFSAFLVFFTLYFISALQTAKAGIHASEQIREKYELN
jgi:hypothetical protein